MNCQNCGHGATSVLDSRSTYGGEAVRRRRVCAACDGRFTTLETVPGADLPTPERAPRGEQSGAAVLTAEVVRWARDAYRYDDITFREIAEMASNELGEPVAMETVQAAVRGLTWRHLDGAVPVPRPDPEEPYDG